MRTSMLFMAQKGRAATGKRIIEADKIFNQYTNHNFVISTRHIIASLTE